MKSLSIIIFALRQREGERTIFSHLVSYKTNKAPPIYPLVRDLTVALKVQQGRYIQDTQFSLDFIAFLEEMVPHRASFSMLHFLSQTAS